MTAPLTTELLTYAKLQMAAEAFIRDPDTKVLAPPETALINALVTGNKHTSVFTESEALKFDAEWTVLDQKTNTTTGFSGTLFKNNTTGELVLSFRSTEFIDDAVRDNQATNTLELKEHGWAFGQIADMEDWYQTLKADSDKLGSNQFSVTGYSLGAHLATAFNLMRDQEERLDGISNPIAATYTFNGAGVGEVDNSQSLKNLIGDFDRRRKNTSGTEIEVLFNDSEARAAYSELRSRWAGDSGTGHTAAFYATEAARIEQMRTRVSTAVPLPGVQPIPASFYLPTLRNNELGKLQLALERIGRIQAEIERLATPGFSSGDGSTRPQEIEGPANVAGLGLDYQLAVLNASERTNAYRADVVGGGIDALFGRNTRGPLLNFYDVYASNTLLINPSAVANSQLHYGVETAIFIEDQPLYRGNVIGEVGTETLKAGEVKLLVQNYSQNDFGDTHSLVLIVDSLSVQNVLAQLDTSISPATLNAILRAGANHRASSAAGTQGMADGDSLENLVNALGAYLGVDAADGWTHLRGSTSGATWFEVSNQGDFTGRASLYANLDLIANDPDYQDLLGNVKIETISGDLANQAKLDFGALVTLQTLSPFVMRAANGVGEAMLNELWTDFWQQKYDEWQADKVARSSGLPPTFFTDKWLSDRSDLLKWNVARNTSDVEDVRVTGLLPTVIYSDAGSSTLFTVASSGTSPTALAQAKRVTFGDIDAVDLAGESKEDHLYGGGGSDTLTGLRGNDYLEGNADNDILDGGTGNDILMGGSGTDAYIFRSGDGQDTVIDSGTGDRVRIGNDTLSGGKETTSGSRIWQSTDKRYRYYMQPESDGSQSLVILSSTASDQIKVRNFINGQLGITLDGLPAPTPGEPSLTIVGDRAPIDANPNEPGIQTSTDSLGNIVTDPNQPEPGRADTLYDSSGNDFILGLGGADGIYAQRGGNDYLEAGAGDDYVEGGTGDDTILGGSGVDILRGDADDDRLYAAGDVALSINEAILLGRSQTATHQRGDWLTGGKGGDVVVGGADNDVLFGGAGSDVLVGGGGDDVLNGSDDFVAVDRAWTITVPSGGNIFDRLYSPIYNFNEGDHLANAGTDLLYGGGGNDFLYGGYGDDFLRGEADHDTLAGGGGDDVLYGGSGNDKLTGDTFYLTWDGGVPPPTGNDRLFGEAGVDILYGEAGDDLLNGGTDNDEMQGDIGSDTYEYALGDGNDTLIDVYVAGETNTLRLDGLDESQVKLSFYGQGYVLTMLDGATLKLQGNYAYSTSSTDGTYELQDVSRSDIQSIVFGDGGEMDWGALLQRGFTQRSTVAGATVLGTNHDDTLSGTGNATLRGGKGSDTYQVSYVGITTVQDQRRTGDVNVVQFGGGISAGQMRATLDAGVLKLSWWAGGELRVGGVDANNVRGSLSIDRWVFADGSQLDLDSLLARGLIVEGSNVADVLTGAQDVVNEIRAGAGQDRLRGGALDDVLDGGTGGDTYVFTRGAGHDLVKDHDTTPGSTDTIELGPEVLPQDVTVSRDLTNLTLTIHGTDGSVDSTLTVQDWFVDEANHIERVLFADNTVWDAAMLELLVAVPTAGNDHLFGTDDLDTLRGGLGDDALTGYAGDDFLEGGEGNDTYFVALGDGVDEIVDASGYDTLVFGAGIASTALWLRTENGRDLMIGYGDDENEVVLVRDGMSGVIESVVIDGEGGWTVDQLWAIQQGLQAGSPITAGVAALAHLGPWKVVESEESPVEPDSSLSNPDGSDFTEVFYELGSDGADNLSHEVTYYVDEDETIHVILVAGKGNDTVGFYVDADLDPTPFTASFVFNIGDGADTLVGRSDVRRYVEFGSGITAQSLRLSETARTGRYYNYQPFGGGYWVYYQTHDLNIRYSENDVLTIRDGAGWGQVDGFRFADGSIYSLWDLRQARSNGLTGGGEKAWRGTEGNDVYAADAGTGGRATAALDGVAYGLGGDDSFFAGAGDDELYGGAGDDLLDGGEGNDLLDGGTGTNVYRQFLNSGHDVIRNFSSMASGHDTIVFGQFIAPEDIQVRRYGKNLVLDISGADSSVTVLNWFETGGARVDRIVFADTQQWQSEDLLSRLQTTAESAALLVGGEGGDSLIGSAQDDLLIGHSGNDTLEGGAGVDTLHGGAGSDVYVFNLGDGYDVIEDSAVLGGNTIRFGAGIDHAQIEIWVGEVGMDVIYGPGGDDWIAVLGLDSSGLFETAAVQHFEFADSPTRSLSQMQVYLLPVEGAAEDDHMVGTVFNDQLRGAAGNDLLVGAAGNDSLEGEGGSDIYEFNMGDGLDVIKEHGPFDEYEEDIDVIKLGTGVLPGSVSVERSGEDLVLHYGDGDQITVKWWFEDYEETPRIERVEFADSTTVWDAAELTAMAGGSQWEVTHLDTPETYVEDTPLDLTGIAITADSGVSLIATLTLSDPRAGSLSSQSVGIVNASWNAQTGVWQATGDVADLNAVLAQLRFSPNANFNGNFDIVTSVSDGVAPAVTGSKSFTGVAVNDAPTGEVTLSGMATQSQTLTAADTLADADGMGTVTYQWQSSADNGTTWSEISGATANSFTLTQAQVGTLVRVNASYTDGMGTAENRASAATATVANVNATPTATNLSASETYTEDVALNLVDIVASDADHTSLSVTLTLSNVAAGGLSTATSGAVTSTYNAGTGVWAASGAAADVNALLSGASFTPKANFNGDFSVATSVSDGVAPAVTGVKSFTGIGVNDAPTGNVTVSGTATQNQTLTAADTLADVDGLGAIAYQWQSSADNGTTWSDVSGAMAGGIVLAQAHVGKQLRVNASYTDGGGTLETRTSTATAAVANVNDAPTATNLGASEAYTEDVPLDLADIVVNDVDHASLTVKLTLSNVAAGRLSTGTSGAVTSTYNASTGVWTASGATADLNALLAGLRFLPKADFNGSLSIATSVSDGTASAVTGSKSFTGIAVNDAPTGAVSVAGTATQNQTLTASSTLADVEGLGTLGYQWQSSSDGGASWAAIAGATTSSLKLTQAQVALNVRAVVSYVDGKGTAESRASIATAMVANVNDAPTATNLGAAQTYTEDVPLNLADIVVSDPDGGALTVKLTLSNTAAGSLNTGASGAAMSTYNAATGVWTVSGAAQDVNALLANLSFTPSANFNGSFSIATSVSDGIAAPVTGSKAFTGTAVNDAPTATNLAVTESYIEDVSLNLADIVVADVDSASLTVKLTLSNAAAGKLSTGTSGGVTSTYNAGTGVWSASGAAAGINALLASLSFTPSANFSGDFSIATSVSDGTAAPLTGSKSFTGTAVNDAPTATNLSTAQTYTEDTALNLVDIVAADVDSPHLSVSLTLSNLAAGSLSTATSGGVTSSFDAASGTWSASGATASVNALLAGLVFTPGANFNGNFSIATRVSDGVAPAVTGSMAFKGTAVNDAPTALSLHAAETYTEDMPLNLSDIVATDVDSASLTVKLTLSNSAAGSLNAGTFGAVTSTYSSGTWTASGATANVNALLAGLVFTPSANFNGNFSIATSVSDGVAAAVTGSKSFTGLAVNDAPTGGVTVSGTATQNQTLTTANNLADVDGVGTVSYQWHSSVDGGATWVAIAGATASTFKLTQAQVGKSVRASASYVDTRGTPESKASAGTVAVANVNDAPTASHLSTAQTYTEDEPLDLADIVVADPDDASLTVKLTLSNAAAGRLNAGVSGSANSSFNTSTGVWTASGLAADLNTLLAALSFTPSANFNGNFSIATSVSDGIAAALTGSKSFTGTAVNDAPTGAVTVAGKFEPGETLTATSTLADAEGLGTLTYQWQSSTDGGAAWNAIVGATSTSLLLTEALMGHSVRVSVRYTDGRGTAESYASAASASVAPHVTGTMGDDFLEGTDYADVMDGLAGNDTVVGGAGDNVFLFGKGDGHDVIGFSWDINPARVNTLQFKGGVLASDLRFRQVNDGFVARDTSLEVAIAGTSDTVMIQLFFADAGESTYPDYLANPDNPSNPIQQFRFADGALWDLATIASKPREGSGGDDKLYGTAAADIISGLGGIDWVFGRGGNDTLHGGAAHDYLAGDDGNDVLDGGADGDIVEGGAGVDTVRGGDGADLLSGGEGDDWISGESGGDNLFGDAGNDILLGGSDMDVLCGGAGDDTLDGGAGTDSLLDREGNNQFLFGRGDGEDWIGSNNEAHPEAGVNTLRFKAGVSASDLRFSVGRERELEVSIAGTTDKVTIEDFFRDHDPTGDYNPVQRFQFEDGTGWDLATITAMTLAQAGTADDDTLLGTVGPDVLNGRSGGDYLIGLAGEDTLAGGAGAYDWLEGGTGDDTYVIGRGDGVDLIVEDDATEGNHDRVRFGPDIAADQLWFSRSGDELMVSIIGTEDAMRLGQWYQGERYRVESFQSSDGKTLLDSQVQNLVDAMASFAPPAIGETTLPANYRSQLDPVLAANWN